MRIYGTGGTALAAKPAGARRSAGVSFSISAPETPQSMAAASGLRTISTVDALMALQGIETPLERRKRALAKGRNALDVLDRLKIGLIDGTLDQSTLARLKVAADGLTEQTGDPGLDSVLSEIDLRVAVELAKAGVQ